MAHRLAGKTALVTAAGQGIGRATAEAFAQHGAQVLAADINPTALAGLDGVPGLRVLRLDVTDAAAVSALARTEGPFAEAVSALFVITVVIRITYLG